MLSPRPAQAFVPSAPSANPRTDRLRTPAQESALGTVPLHSEPDHPSHPVHAAGASSPGAGVRAPALPQPRRPGSGQLGKPRHQLLPSAVPRAFLPRPRWDVGELKQLVRLIPIYLLGEQTF